MKTLFLEAKYSVVAIVFAVLTTATVAQQIQTAKLVVLLDGSSQHDAQHKQIVDAVRNALVEARRRNYFSNNAAASGGYGTSQRQMTTRFSTRNAEPYNLVVSTVENVRELSTIRLTELVCREISAGAVAFVGPADVYQRRHVRSLCDRVGVVFIEIFMSTYAQAERLFRTQTVMDVSPPRSLYTRAVGDYIRAAGWIEVHFITDNDAALRRLEPLMGDPKLRFTFYQTHQIADGNNSDESYLLAVRQLWRQYKGAASDAVVVAVRNVPSFVNAHQMHTRFYNYLFVDLDTHLFIRGSDEQLAHVSRIGANISVLKVHQRDQQQLNSASSAQSALAYDATLLLAKGLAQLVSMSNSDATVAPFIGQASCGDATITTTDTPKDGRSTAWPHGDTLLNMLETAASDEVGLTGALSLHRSAQSSELTRRAIEFDLLRLTRSGAARAVQHWTADGGWRAVSAPFSTGQNGDDDEDTVTPTTAAPVQVAPTHTVLRVATRLGVPFVMKAPPDKIDKNIRPRDKSAVVYQGYCVDLVNALAEREKFYYRFVVAPDNQPGVPLDDDGGKVNGSWSGMIGMLLRRIRLPPPREESSASGNSLLLYARWVASPLRAPIHVFFTHVHETQMFLSASLKEADMAVADLSVTARRSAVVDFTEPFMTQGIGVLFQSPRPVAPHLFGLLKAYSPLVWVNIVVALIIVSQMLRILGRLSPYEWTNSHECTGAAGHQSENNFNYRNSLWFCASTFMLQGCDINPRAPSTRLLAASWWVFALVLWISYVANLAAFLTVDTMSTPIRSVDDLAKQATIKYGIVRNSSQEEFFRASKVPTFRQMWNTMSATPSVFAASDDEGKERVKAGGYAYLTDMSRIRYWANRNCSLAQVGTAINVDYFAIALPEGSTLVETLSRGILAMKAKSLAQFEDKWWKASGIKCNEQGSGESSGPQPLTAKVVGGIYVLGLVGLLVAFIVAIIEFVWQARKNAREHGTRSSIWKEMLRELYYAFLIHRPPRRAPRHAALETATATRAIAGGESNG